VAICSLGIWTGLRKHSAGDAAQRHRVGVGGRANHQRRRQPVRSQAVRRQDQHWAGYQHDRERRRHTGDIYDLASRKGSATKTVRDVATLTTLLTGIPVSGLARPIVYATEVAPGRRSRQGRVDAARGAINGAAARPARAGSHRLFRLGRTGDRGDRDRRSSQNIGDRPGSPCTTWRR
jgi:hypothetical protein